MITRRRALIAVLGSAVLSPPVSLAQAKRPVVIGVLIAARRELQTQNILAFRDEFSKLGWKEETDYVLEVRYADGRYDKLPSLAKELANKNAAVIVAAPSNAVVAMTKAAPHIPIVTAAGDPLRAGLVSNLAKPGGMITGVTNLVSEVNRKHLQLLLDAAPRLKKVGFLVDPPGNPGFAATAGEARVAAARNNIEIRFAEATRPEEIEPALLSLAKNGTQALIVMASQLFDSERQRIIVLASVRKWPSVAGHPGYAEAGGLLAYGVDRAALYRRCAVYVDKILKGAKPGDLPIEQPTKFELVVNMSTARALDLKIPQSLLVQATKVIE